MTAALQRVGRSALEGIEQLGRIARFSGVVSLACLSLPIRIRRICDEFYDAGVLSLTIVCTSALVVGGVLGLQGYNSLSLVGAEESLGAAVGLTLIRELGPVMTGLLVATIDGTVARLIEQSGSYAMGVETTVESGTPSTV